MSSTTTSEFQPSSGEPQVFPAKAKRKGLVRRGCLLAFIVVALLIAVPAYWWLSTYAPVTVFQARNTSTVHLSSSTCGQWDTTVWPIISSFSSGGVEAVDAASENDLWAVTFNGNVLRGDGQNWRQVQTLKTADGKEVRAHSVEVRSSDDVWVIGWFESPLQSALFHWDGKSFLQVHVPSAAASSVINSVAALGERDAWFVGSGGLVLRWNGDEIAVVEPADKDIKGFDLYSVSAISPDDIWAAGTLAGQAYGEAIAAHWDGKEWRVAKKWGGENSPGEDNPIITLWDVLAIGHDDVWVAGTNRAAHWDGQQWAEPKMPSFDGYGNVLFSSITASASDDLWAVGYGWTDNPRPFAMRWDGTKWSIVQAPRPLNLGSFDTAKAFPDKLWAAGSAYQDEDYGPVYSMSAEFKPASCP